MVVNKQVTLIESYIHDNETKLRMDLAEDLSKLYQKRSLIEEKYSVKKIDAEERYRSQQESIKSICEQAKMLINGIRRKLYKRQKRLVAVEQDDSVTPEKKLIELQEAIGKFEKTNLPFGLRQFFDSISLLFNSNYGQAEVDRITQLYQSLVLLQESGELEKRLDDELTSYEEAKLKEIYSIDRTMNSIVDERVDDYIYSLQQMIFANV